MLVRQTRNDNLTVGYRQRNWAWHHCKNYKIWPLHIWIWRI